MSIRNKITSQYILSNEEWRKSMRWFIPKLLFRFYTPIVIGWGIFALIVWLAGK